MSVAVVQSPGTDDHVTVASQSRVHVHLAQPRAVLVVAVLGFFVVTLDAFVANVALPSIGSDLGSGITGPQWVVDGYTLTFAALLLSAGALSDRIGARTAFGIGLATFTAASVACGFAPHFGVLIASRMAQGAGAAVMLPASLALIRDAYSNGRDRARAIALWSFGAAVASSAGPAVGGLLTLVSWRMIFFINLPVGLFALCLLLWVSRSPRRSALFDWVGQVTAIVGMGALIYGLIEGGAAGFAALHVVGALAVALVAVIAFVVSQARGAQPMVPLQLFRARPVAIPMSVGFSFAVGFYGLVFLFSLYLQELRGLSPLTTGLSFVPMTAFGAVLTLITPRIGARFGTRVPIAIGQTLMAVGLASLVVAIGVQAPVLLLVSLTIPVGAGSALTIPTITALLLGSVPVERAGTASGVRNTSRQLGGAMAVAVFGAFVAQRETFVSGMQVSLTVGAALLLATMVASLRLGPKIAHA
jgi:DHA2 family methylenomycin A resistance protein-like MFS transporter